MTDLTGQTRTVDHAAPGPNIGFEFEGIHALPDGTIILGGRVLGVGANRTLPWRDLYDLGNGGAIRWEGSSDITILKNYNEYTWDPYKPRGPRGRIRRCWIRECRDDAIEHDAVNSFADPTLWVEENFFDYGHTFLSITPGQGAAQNKPVTVHWTGNVMSLGHHLDDGRPAETRDKRLQYAWAEPINGSGQPFKVRGMSGGGGAGITLNFNNNAVMFKYGMNTAKSNIRLFQDMQVMGSANRFYYLGDFKGLTPIDFMGARIPAEFEIHKHPELWSHVSNDPDEWEAEIANWKTAVWQDDATPPPPDCAAEIDAAVAAARAPLEARIADLEEDLDALHKGISQVITDLQSLL